MAKQGEIDYLKQIGAAGIEHAVHKPFSDPGCPGYLVEIGAVMGLLPAAPARLLDLGCGTGWTSRFFARRGYDVLGVDISPDMIEQANLVLHDEHFDNLRFQACDYEDLDLGGEFDCAVFYDALHHAVDEHAALRAVYRALRPGGVCVTSEPGVGHASSPDARAAVEKYGVTERDMPPGTIIAAARRAGFRDFLVYPHAAQLRQLVYDFSGWRLRRWVERWRWLRLLGSTAAVLYLLLIRRHSNGIVVLVK
jgi:SAM-dependent methyltransferase